VQLQQLLEPIHGTGWFARKKRARMRAIYNRKCGTEQLPAFYDVHADCLQGVVRKRKTSTDVLAAFRRLRVCYPAGVRIYLLMDNLSSHKQKDVSTFIEGNKREVAWTPTYSSWLTATEAHFTSLKKFVLSSNDDMSHDERRKRIDRYFTWLYMEHTQQETARSLGLGVSNWMCTRGGSRPPIRAGRGCL
jgi:transposase